MSSYDGGTIVAIGTPEDIAVNGVSHGGGFLREVLGRWPLRCEAGGVGVAPCLSAWIL